MPDVKMLVQVWREPIHVLKLSRQGEYILNIDIFRYWYVGVIARWNKPKRVVGSPIGNLLVWLSVNTESPTNMIGDQSEQIGVYLGCCAHLGRSLSSETQMYTQNAIWPAV